MQSITVKIAYVISTFFGAGRAPKAPGTVGSLVALPFAYALWKLPPMAAWGTILAVFLIGVWAADIVIKDGGQEDPGFVVIDEVVGIFITTALAGAVWWKYVAGFVLFRIFDIGKPYPISYADRNFKGGFGAMLDDAIAGGIALLVFYLFQISWPYLTRLHS